MTAGQPRLGLLGLVLVVPIATLLALGAGGAERSALVLGPLVTYAVPLVAMVAFWWERWPGTRLRPSWSGWADTVLIAIGAVALAEIAGADLEVAAAAFVAMLQLTLVGEGWPLRGLPRVVGGLLAVALSWAVALAVHLTGLELGAALIVIGSWQTLFFVAWRGWPFSRIASRGLRLVCAHAAVLGSGILSYLLLHDLLAVGRASLAAAGGCAVAAALLVGMQFEGWLGRPAALAATVALAAALAVGLHAVAAGLEFTRASPDEWVTHVSLNALGASVILHVAIGRRWPFDQATRSASTSAARASRSSAAT